MIASKYTSTDLWQGRFYILCIVLIPVILLSNFGDKISKLVSTRIDLKYPSAVTCECPASARNDNNAFIVGEYKAAAKEIQERLQFEHLLFALKFAAAGAIIGFISQYYTSRTNMQRKEDTWIEADEKALMKSRGAALCCWIAVCVCQIIDVRLQSNTSLIANIGIWVKECLETCFIEKPLMGWETYFSQMGYHKGPLSFVLNMERQLFTWFLFVMTVFVFVYMPKKASHMSEKDAERFLLIAKRILPLNIVLFGWTGFYPYLGIRWVNYAYIFLVLLLSCLAVLCVSRLSNLKLR